jgi:unsaturated rhamnogalacturonyl hydrolase
MKDLIKRIQLLIFILLLPVIISAQQLWSVRMAESVMKRHPNVYGNWDYQTGTVLRGFEEVWRVTGDKRYFDYIKTTVDHVVNENGIIDNYNLFSYNLDEINEGRMLLLLYKETGEQKYKDAADLLRRQLENQPRNDDGGFWHKKVYPHQMWLDGLYMGSPFYAEYSLLFNDPDGFNDVALQLILMEKHARDPETGLLYHGYDDSREQAWADSVTGQSPSFWGRAIGWYAMALVDVLDYLPENHSKRDSIIDIFNHLVEGMIAVQDESGVWWQVVDKGGHDGNYLEASVSCMMVYAMAKAIRMGYISKTYLPVVLDSYNSLLSEFITANSDSSVNLIRTCSGAGLGGNPYRDGSYNYYIYQTSIRDNDSKGVGPFITASIEIERMSLPQNFTALALSESSIQLTWHNVPNSFEGYQVLRSTGATYSEVTRIPSTDSVYIDNNLDSLTVYQYRLRPYIDGKYGLYSNIAHVSTLGGNGRPSYPLNPSPANDAVNQGLDIQLSWEAGTAATSNNVYFGESNPPGFVTNQTETVFDPGLLKNETNYYWRVDGVNNNGKTTGPVWNFSTEKAPLPLGLVARWPVSEGMGTILKEIEGGNNATLTNTDPNVWQTGNAGTYVVFDGVDDYAIVPHKDELNFGDQSFSLSFWIKQNTQDRAMRYIIKGTHTSPGSGKRYEVFHHQNNEVRFAIDDNSTKSSLAVPNTNFVTGKWVHVVAIRDVENKILKLFANNELQGTLTDNTGDISQNEDLFFGLSPDETNTNLKGSLKDIRFFNYAIRDSLISALYSDGITTVHEKENNILQENIYLEIYPNPFNITTRMKYKVLKKGHVQIIIYNITGQKIITLLNEVKALGEYEIPFNADKFSSGLFLVHLKSGSQNITKKILLIK